MAAAGVLSYPVCSSFDSYVLHNSPRLDRSYFGPARNNHKMSQPTSDGAAPSQNDASRVALPSISNLLGIADGSRPETASGMCHRLT